MQATKTFQAEVESPRAAREFLLGVLAVEPDHETYEVASILTSELVTNAVVHARTSLDVRVELNDDQLRVEVTDGDPCIPRPFDPDPDSPSGRGLFLVDALASSWGVDPEIDGKTVWFTLPDDRSRPSAPTAGSRPKG